MEIKTQHGAVFSSPNVLNLSFQDIQAQRKADNRVLSVSSASVVWLNSVMITGSIGLLIYASFTQELFFANERNSEFVFGVMLCVVLSLWYLHVIVQLLKSRSVDFFANSEGAFILANGSRQDYFFIPWTRVIKLVVSRGYYNGSAAAITLHTQFSTVPESFIKRGHSHATLDNGKAIFTVIPNSFLRYEDALKKTDALFPSDQ